MKMRISVMVILLLLALAQPANPQSEISIINSVEPAAGRIGDMFLAQGVYLNQERVAALYMTDGATDIRVVILEQTSTSIRFQIPPEAKPGRFALMILTKGKEPKLMEEPVKIIIQPETT
jgi:hypothetical protein